MTREIKFRAWVRHPTTNEMVMRTSFYTLNSDGEMNCVFPIDAKTPKDRLNIVVSNIVMQYTGLKDKNGKEIYEGDILQSEYTFKKAKVIWDAENCRFLLWEPRDTTSFFHHKIDDHSVLISTVIGNIYENPELIEVKK
jgi:hypothetical protein